MPKNRNEAAMQKMRLIMWNNTISIQPVPGRPKKRDNIKTFAFRETSPSKLLFGGHEQMGSIADDTFNPREHLHDLSNSTTAKFNLMCENEEKRLTLKSVMSSPQIASITNKYEKCFALKKEFRNRLTEYNNDSVLPVFGTLDETIYFYAASHNGAWAMFYAEFYQFINFFSTLSTVLLVNNLGFIETFTDESVFPTALDDRNACPHVLAALDSIVRFISEIENRTMCLLQPVGLQHMTVMDDLVELLTEVIKSVKTSMPKFLKKVNINTNVKTHITWRRAVDLLETCLVALKIACMFSALVSHFVKQVREDILFSAETINTARLEDPIGYGYKLRKAEIARFFLNGKSGGYVPFDFYRFINFFSRFTKIDFLDYLPCFRRAKLFIQTTAENNMTFWHSNISRKTSKFDPSVYFHCLYRSFGTRHEQTIKRFMMRMKEEAMRYSSGCENLGKRIIESELDPVDYPAILLLFSRNDQVKTAGEKISAETFYQDLFTKGRSEGTLWRTWVHIAKATFLEFNVLQNGFYSKEIDFSRIYKEQKRIKSEKATKAKLGIFYRLTANTAKIKKQFAVFRKMQKLVQLKVLLHKRQLLACVAREAAEKAKAVIKNRKTESLLANAAMVQEKEKINYRLRVLEMSNALYDLARRLEYFLILNLPNDHWLLSNTVQDGSPLHGAVSIDVFLNFPSLLPFYKKFKCTTVQSCRNLLLNATRLSSFIQVLSFDHNSFHAFLRGCQYVPISQV